MAGLVRWLRRADESLLSALGGRGGPAVDNVLTWMKKNITYKDSTGPINQLDFKTVDDIVERGHAECLGYATLFTALCRAAKVPAFSGENAHLFQKHVGPETKSRLHPRCLQRDKMKTAAAE